MLELPMVNPQRTEMKTDDTRRALNGAQYWLVANVVGIFIYFRIQSWILAPRSEADSFNGFDEMYYWMNMEGPLLGLFLVVNLIWLTLAIKRGRGEKNWLPSSIWLLACLIWCGSIFTNGMAPSVLHRWIMVIGGR